MAYIAFALPAITRQERVEDKKEIIFDHYSDKQQDFIDFVLQHYVSEGVSELDDLKLPDLLTLKYETVPDAVGQLGSISDIREVFISFQEYLYRKEAG